MSKSYFVEQEWIDNIRGGVFYYPAAGQDTTEPIAVFSEHTSEMHFCDIRYCDLEIMQPALPVSPDVVEFIGPRSAELIRLGRSNQVEPGKRIEIYTEDRTFPLRIVRRRGFGQMGLAEFPYSSISVFMHRGDSMGEGGSNAFFLANRPKRYPPLGNLFSKLVPRLRNTALIITDGSNSDIAFTKKYREYTAERLSPQDIYSDLRGKEHLYHGLVWACVGWMSKRYGPTLVWSTSKH